MSNLRDSWDMAQSYVSLMGQSYVNLSSSCPYPSHIMPRFHLRDLLKSGGVAIAFKLYWCSIFLALGQHLRLLVVGPLPWWNYCWASILMLMYVDVRGMYMLMYVEFRIVLYSCRYVSFSYHIRETGRRKKSKCGSVRFPKSFSIRTNLIKSFSLPASQACITTYDWASLLPLSIRLFNPWCT